MISKVTAFLELIALKLTNLYRFFVLSKGERHFVNYAKKQWVSTERGGGILLLETMKYHPYIFQISHLSNFLAEKFELDIRAVVNAFDDKNIWLNRYCNKILTTSKLFSAFGAPMGLNYYSLKKEEVKTCEARALDTFNKIKTKADLLSLEIEGVNVGDLIYDTHLRLHKLATVDINDGRLLKTIENAYIISFSCKNYLSSHNVNMLIMLHAVYIQHAILVRQAILRGIPTYIYGHREGRLVQKLSKNHFTQSLDHHQYKDIFATLIKPTEALASARKVLNKRVSGEIDTGISYMRKSAYVDYQKENSNAFRVSDKPRLVIFLHCFFDSPHIYKDMLFNDFHEWLDVTLNMASKSDYEFYVKPHPNGLEGNDAIVNSFIQKYENITFIDKTISNRQLINEGFDMGVTLYGTIAHELAYHGIPVLAAGDNPHACYSFCYKAKDVLDFEEVLHHYKLKPDIILKAEIEQFFYMHYLYQSDLYANSKGNWDEDLQKNNNDSSNALNSLVADAKMGKFEDVNHYFEDVLNHLN